MDYKEYLLNQSAVNLAYIAKQMWPTNKNAKSYLSTKLHDKGRPFTEEDEKKARAALKELGVKLVADSDKTDL